MSLFLTSSLLMFWCKEFWIITLIILLIVYISGKSKHLIYGNRFVCCWKVSSPPNSKTVSELTSLHPSLIFPLHFYLPDFPSIYSQTSLPLLSCRHRTNNLDSIKYGGGWQLFPWLIALEIKSGQWSEFLLSQAFFPAGWMTIEPVFNYFYCSIKLYHL